MSMFGQPKPLASLSSSLLARKGQARPAMRPQGFGGFGSIQGAQDDLGWNDMGHEEAPFQHPVAVPPVLRQREALHEEFAPTEAYPEPETSTGYFETPDAPAEQEAFPVPQACQGPEAVEEVYHEEPEAVMAPAPAPVATPRVPVVLAPVSLATAARISRETVAKHAKAAFTLRLDHDRHLRLRLASALKNVSAQHLVTEALDAFLHTLPEVEELARQLPSRTGR